MKVKTMESYDYVTKVVIIGDSGVGKTSLLNRFVDDKYEENRSVTIGIDTKIKTIFLPEYNKTIKLQLWDTAGQERYQSVTRSYYKGSLGALVVFAFDDLNSFEHVRQWIRYLREYTTSCKTIVMIGNKSDIPPNERKVTHKQGHDMANEWNIEYLETSAKVGKGVNEAFVNMARSMVKKYEEEGMGSIKSDKKLFEYPRLAGDEDQKDNKKSCCK